MISERCEKSSEAEITSQYEAIAKVAGERLARNERIRRNLPAGGRLRIDRQLPFLCVCRSPGADDDVGTRELVTTEAAYLFATSDARHHAGLSYLCSVISAAMQEHFGTFLLIEIWASEARQPADELRPAFEIVSSDLEGMPSTIEVLQKSLMSVAIAGNSARVTTRRDGVDEARGLPPILSACGEAGSPDCWTSCCRLGLIVEPIYRDRTSGGVFPVVLQELRWKLATTIRKTISEFTGQAHEVGGAHYDTFGPSSLVQAAGIVDQQLCEVSESFDFLLQVTPTNADEAWEGFRKSRYRELPRLSYRHLPYHPSLVKRRLFAIEIERVEDPTLAHLFWEKQAEIDRQLTSLRELHLPEMTVNEHPRQSSFMASSLQLYGSPEDALVELASEILERFPPQRKYSSLRVDTAVTAVELEAYARAEVDYYQTRMSEFKATIELSQSIASGIMVSHDRLLIADDIAISPRRLEPLLHHEIGTHLLTYFNGRCQPFRQLYAGLAGYEELQEGLAVLAEYLVGGLTRRRLRTLAARVMAVHWMTRGTAFASVFHRLHGRWGLARRQAFTTTLRAFRGGGLTKDLIYLRGLRDLLDYLAKGHDIEPLYVGKIGLHQVPYIQELRRRGIITPPRMLPRFLDEKLVRERLEACRGKSVLDLMETDE